MTIDTFPFGQPDPVREQADRGPKRLCVPGEYASAVRARWCDTGGRHTARAVGVASAPRIFW